MKTYRHLTLQERELIEEQLNKGLSFQAIGRMLDRHGTTVSREVKRHLLFRKSGGHGHPFNDCMNRSGCGYSHLCDDPDCISKFCQNCPHCSKHCTDYVKEECRCLDSPPYVCNGCRSRGRCTLEKRLYVASYAHKEYMQVQSETSSGIHTTEEELRQLDAVLSPLLKQGHSLHHILLSNPSLKAPSIDTLYKYINAGFFSARNIDLPRKVRFRGSLPHKPRYVPNSCRIGRTYQDLQVYLKSQPGCPIVQLDSVEGTRGGKVLLSIHFVNSSFMLAFLRNRNSSSSVHAIFEELYRELTPDIFMKLFPILLADNGCEFSNPLALEFDARHNQRTHVFYCNPRAPYQKGAAENNHAFIRRILPKGTSFNHLTQEKINLMMNHINSYRREALGNKSPYEIFRHFYGQEILEKLGATLVPPNSIVLRPALLK